MKFDRASRRPFPFSEQPEDTHCGRPRSSQRSVMAATVLVDFESNPKTRTAQSNPKTRTAGDPVHRNDRSWLREQPEDTHCGRPRSSQRSVMAATVLVDFESNPKTRTAGDPVHRESNPKTRTAESNPKTRTAGDPFHRNDRSWLQRFWSTSSTCSWSANRYRKHLQALILTSLLFLSTQCT
jgi:hypothetical protein